MSDLIKKHIELINLLTRNLRHAYITSCLCKGKIREAVFAQGMLEALVDSFSLFPLATKIVRKELADCLTTHYLKYLNKLTELEAEEDTIEQFKKNYESVKEELKKDLKDTSGLRGKEHDAVAALVSWILQKVQNIFAEQNHNEKEIDQLIAKSIAIQIGKDDIGELEKLTSDLHSIHEVWQLFRTKEYEADHKKIVLLQSDFDQFDFAKVKNEEERLQIVVDYMINELELLHELSEEALLNMYLRIRNNERIQNNLCNLLAEIHHESKIRYSCTKLSDTGYELLNIFQKYDAILQHIEKLEFNLVENYFLKGDNFLVDSFSLIRKHVDNLCFLKLSNNKDLNTVLHKLDSQLHKSGHEQENPKLILLEEFRTVLSNAIDPNILKKFQELDGFQIATCKQKYEQLFAQIAKLTDEKEDNTEFLKSALNRVLAADYYIPNIGNVISKIRDMEKDRIKVYNLLSKIDLYHLFEDMHGSRIKTIHFNKKAGKVDTKTPEHYVRDTIRNVLTVSTAFQIDHLYRPLLEKKLNNVESLLKNEISQQIHIRSSLTKMMISIFSGKKKEVKKLRQMKKMHK